MMDKSETSYSMETGNSCKEIVVAVPAKKNVNNSNETSRKESTSPSGTVEMPRTLELRKNGYLALARGLGSGMYDQSPTGLQSQASAAFEFMTRQSRDQFAAAVAAGMGDDIRDFRQSSIDSEPQTLPVFDVRQAKDGAAEIIESYDQEEAVHLFLKDAEDEHLREEALAAILPTAELGVSL
jgi:hypothetical protein